MIPCGGANRSLNLIMNCHYYPQPCMLKREKASGADKKHTAFRIRCKLWKEGSIMADKQTHETETELTLDQVKNSLLKLEKTWRFNI